MRSLASWTVLAIQSYCERMIYKYVFVAFSFIMISFLGECCGARVGTEGLFSFQTQICELYLGNNPLKEIPGDLVASGRLCILSLFDCCLRDLPSSIEHSAGSLVRVLSLFPSLFRSGKSLTFFFWTPQLRLVGNNLTALPPIVSELYNLETLSISDNPLIGAGDWSPLASLSRLVRLEVAACGLRVLPHDVINMQHVRTVFDWLLFIPLCPSCSRCCVFLS